MPRPMKRAPAPRANASGETGWSTEPSGVDGVRVPSREVGEYWPLVSPYASLLNRSTFTSTLRRSRCSRWLPPMLSPSPSPVTSHTSSSGLASFTPVANAGARPWMVCIPYVSM